MNIKEYAATMLEVFTPKAAAKKLNLGYYEEEDAVVLPGLWATDGEYDCCFPDGITPQEAANDYVEEGSWPKTGKTVWHAITTFQKALRADLEEIRIEQQEHTIRVDPAEPECSEDEHDWQSPHHLVGGIESNPGVWGKGGGVVVHEACIHCGCRRTTDTWAQNRSTGEQGLTSVEYEPGYYPLDKALAGE